MYLLIFVYWFVRYMFYMLFYFECYFVFFFSSRRRHTRCLSDWSSDVCSSDLDAVDDYAKQRRVGRRDVDVGAPDAVARRPTRDREHPSVPARDAVRRVARVPPDAGRLGAGGARRVGLRALHARDRKSTRLNSS